MEGRIFINYRREISAAAAGRLSDRLIQHFDQERLFMDVDGIEPGVDFVKALDDQVAQCSAFIAVIGPGWTDLKNAEGQRRLDQPNDYVRVEIESALRRDIRVIPVLVDGARMPTADELPDSLKAFARRNAVMLSHHRFGPEVDELARVLQRALGSHPKSTTIYSFAATDTRPSWINYLFSFKGRISRTSFWLSGLGLWGVTFLVGVAFMAVLGEGPFVLGKDAVDAQKLPSQTLAKLYNIAVLPFYWPIFALYLKRLHDFGQGLGLLWWSFLILSVLRVVPIFVEGFPDDTAHVVSLLGAGLIVVVGCIKGTPGRNRYGPAPLASVSRSDIAWAAVMKQGDRVMHNRLGIGTIVAIAGTDAEVKFDAKESARRVALKQLRLC
jgi:uncharacterized membrane protein YhaH (DUF805 family)